MSIDNATPEEWDAAARVVNGRAIEAGRPSNMGRVTVKGTEIPGTVQATAIELMKHRHTFTAFAVACEIARCMGCDCMDEVAYRGADRLVQRERKAGNIGPSDPSRNRSSYWRWVGAK